jgi:hypothetical protein
VARLADIVFGFEEVGLAFVAMVGQRIALCAVVY